MTADATLVDISDPRIYVDGPPHETFRWLRDNDPVSRQVSPNGTPYWALTRYADIREVNRSPERFRSGSGITFIDLVDHDRGNDNTAMMINMDAPRHTELRAIVQRVFTPKAIADLESGTRRRARAIVDAVCERGECDFMPDIATQLPLQVIALLLGIPDGDFPRVVGWASGLAAPGTYESVSSAATEKRGSLGQVGLEMAAYAKQLAKQRKADPRDDIVTKLVTASLGSEPMTELEFQMFFAMLFIAGFDTTRHALGNGLEAFMANRDQWERLVRTGTVGTHVVEEVLRWATPIMYMMRTANHDTVIGDQAIAAGDRVAMWYVSGNRDERVGRAHPVRHRQGTDRRPRTQRPRVLRRRWPALLPRPRPGAPRAEGSVRGADPPHARRRAGRSAPARTHEPVQLRPLAADQVQPLGAPRAGRAPGLIRTADRHVRAPASPCPAPAKRGSAPLRHPTCGWGQAAAGMRWDQAVCSS